ncbi:MAG: class I SAM-dependent methyltransferase [Nitrospiraceae bacterium]|nr:class I SAM-dependent methyltransferase [Nitrospiraceae bacterium]
MNTIPSWQYDEMQQIGKDYGSIDEVEAYDERHGKFRDVQRENEEILQLLAATSDHAIIEIGSGTGAFAIQAARRCSRVYAVDISRAMLAYTKAKAEKADISNIEYRHAGFLTYRHDGPPADALVTNTAFHHLPDFWKGIALERMHGMLKHGGLLYLSDVVFDQRNVLQNIDAFMTNLERLAGPGIRKDVEDHVQKEFSTYDWIIEGLLERAGFCVVSKNLLNGVIGRYLCRKE